ncbi:MAG: hypothetical protein A3G08_04420 [Candidatus Magasanikbacteria bacterium RIFCSPLOWO2_12_FULL_47_9b]|nr:MAG: hypothetical protein A3I74_00870 [Candidatus Magasanikbacteria bacterium RIFCSPLOWO2_02_FULL_47_16]OGH80002.1 MAG: hypothetical protein A3C10_02355 [Candidatus Magasanikbacteria bacterium RIFCSPHIGHO2_02_FULL_48_18]OGH82913.1 MAG: hypothetical protein A3G08_04420 [Candidatus Magasanikbacteria bacterium RIFCSPLOWO2_12_FULL_47_9b]
MTIPEFSPLNLSIFLLWFVSAFLDYADHCSLWQLKEYRWDKFKDFLSTKQGKQYFSSYALFFRTLFALCIFFWPLNSVFGLKIILLLFLSADVFFGAHRAVRHGLRRPRFTLRAIATVVFSLCIEFSFLFFYRDWSIIAVVFLFRFYVSTAVVFFLDIPRSIYKRCLVTYATKKIAKYADMVVIGVTGSYGKTSVKAHLVHLLSSSFSVCATPGNVNTEIGVAAFILKTSFVGVRVFVVEMGAYNIGEIAQLCRMVRPKIGILTAINEQHLSLFGSIRNIQKAKYELLRSIPQDGLAITNSDNPYCREFLHELTAQVETFGGDEGEKPTFLVSFIEQTAEGLHAAGVYKGNKWSFLFPKIIGEYQMVNIAPAYIAARFLGVPDFVLEKQFLTICNPSHALSVVPYGMSEVINDSYNSNPDGFRVALERLASFPSSVPRIVVTRGMMELGERSEILHEQIGEEISFIADELVVITKDFYEPLKRGVGEKSRTKVVLKENHEALLAYIQTFKKRKAVLLFENRIPAMVQKEVFGL